MSNSLTRETPLLKRGYLTALDPPLGKWFTWFVNLSTNFDLPSSTLFTRFLSTTVFILWCFALLPPPLLAASELPALGPCNVVNITGETIDTKALCAGGVSIDGGDYESTAVINLVDKAEVSAEITIDPTHQGQTAEIFVYAATTLPASQDELYFMLAEGMSILPWDKDFAGLVSIQQETLKDILSIPLYSGTFILPGNLKIFFGYRLADGTLVSNAEPLEITIEVLTFTGITRLEATSPTTVEVEWSPAKSATTSAAKMVYQVYLAQESDFTPDKDTLYDTITGKTKVELKRLETGTTYYVVVIAEDKEGNRSPTQLEYRSVTTPSELTAGFSSLPAPNSTIDFGTAAVGQAVTQKLTLTETGEADLNVELVGLTGDQAENFNVLSPTFPLTIVNGDEEQTVELQCTPATSGPHAATLELSSNDPSHSEVSYALKCTGKEGSTGTPGFSSTPPPNSTLQFYKRVVNTAHTMILRVKEVGNAPLTVDLIGVKTDFADDFKVLSPKFPFTAEDGSFTKQIKIQCRPSDTGLRTAQLQLSSNDPLWPEINYTVECTGVPMVYWTPPPVVVPTVTPPTVTPPVVTPTTMADYLPTPAVNTTLNFGSNAMGGTATQTITIAESGSAELTLSTFAITGANASDFKVVSPAFPFTIADGSAAQTVSVQCIPTAEGLRTATLQLTSNAAAMPVASYALECTGLAVPTSVEPPPVDRTVVNTLAANNAFLYTGANPLQTGVGKCAIDPNRAAVLRGKVTDPKGQPLAGVKITMDRRPEFGQTLSKADGTFMMAVNSELLTVKYEKDSYLTIQRALTSIREGYIQANDVAMIPRPPETPVTQQSGGVTKVAGEQNALVMFPQGTKATMVLPDCSVQPVSENMAIRASEFTVGNAGGSYSLNDPSRQVASQMPFPLPPGTGYTYAIEVGVDQAADTGGIPTVREVNFDKSLPVYVDNFLRFPVGDPVPAGWYDRTQSAWVPSENGRVVKIVKIENGQAVLDVDGTGPASEAALTALKVTPEELQKLAQQHPDAQNKELWRIPVKHFSPWDFNWPFGPPSDSGPPPNKEPPDYDPPKDPCEKAGCIISAESQILGETVPVVGTPFNLNYRSNRVPGRKAAYTLDIALKSETMPKALPERVELEVNVAGQQFQKVFPTAEIPPSYTFVWDGKDAFGRPLQGGQEAKVRVSYVYKGDYQKPAINAPSSFGLGGGQISGDKARQEISFDQNYTRMLGVWDAKAVGLGGLTLDIHHTYDPNTGTLYEGTGGQREVKYTEKPRQYTTVVQQQVEYVEVTDADLRATHCTDCGTLLVGSAHIDVNSIQWISPKTATRVNANSYSSDEEVGFTGLFSSQGDVDNQWSLYSIGYANINNPTVAGAAPGIGYFIAPEEAGLFNQSVNYQVEFSPQQRGFKSQEVKAEVVADNELTPAITLEIQLNGQPVKNNAVAECVSIPAGGAATFTVTPRVNPALVPAGVAPIENVMVEMCSNDSTQNPQFLRQNVTPNNFVAGDYYHYLRGSRNDGCDQFLVSVNKTVEFKATQQRDTEVGFVKYTFAVKGHHNAVNPAKWAASHKTFHLVSVGGGTRSKRNFDLRNLLYPYSAELENVHSGRRDSCPAGEETTFVGHIASEDGGLLYEFDKGRHIRTIDSLTSQAVYTFTYNDLGYLTEIKDLDGDVTKIERDANNNPVAIVAPYGQRTTLALDANGYLATATNEAGEVHKLTYTADGLLTQYTDPRGNVESYEYNALGLFVKNVTPIGGGYAIARVDSPDGSYITSLTSKEGRVSSYQVAGTKRKNTAPNGTVTESEEYGTWIENANATATTVTSPDGTRIESTKGTDKRLVNFYQSEVPKRTVITTPSYLRAEILTETVTEPTPDADNYDPLQLTKLTNKVTVNERVSTSVFDKAAKTITATSAVGRKSVSVLDDKGRVVKDQAPGFVDTSYTYDARGRLTQVSEGEGVDLRTASLEYDTRGNISKVTDALGRQVSFEYDLVGRVTKQTLTDGRVISYSYDANGNVTTITPPGRPAHGFAYTAEDQQAQYTPPPAGLPTPQTQYVYNLDQELTKIVRPDGQTVEFIYDATKGRLNALKTPDGQYGYSYDDKTGNLTSVTAPDSNTLSYTYDGALPLSVIWGGGITGTLSVVYDNDFRVQSTRINDGNTINYEYDADSLLTKAGDLVLTRSPENGLLTGTQLGSITTQRTYNAFGELTSDVANNAATAVSSTQYSYDKLGRITQKVETLEGSAATTIAYEYDPAGRLVKVTTNGTVTEQYGYDENGNRLTAVTAQGEVKGSYDEQDRLLQYGGNTYAYTANGELLSKTSNAVTTQYKYDVLGNLREVQLPDGKKIEYVIDVSGRRVGKKANGVLTQGWLYQGSLNPIAELDGTGQVVTRFVYGSKANVPDYLVKNGQTYRIVSDHLGSPRLVIDLSTGAVVQRMDYDAFGNVTQDTNPGFQPFGFAGGLYDSETRLVRFGARDYDAETGRWTAKDPITFASGDTNFYGYTLNDPINFVDPNGRLAFLLPMLGNAAIGAGIEALLQVIQNVATGRPWYCLDWKKIGISALGSSLSFGLDKLAKLKRLTDLGKVVMKTVGSGAINTFTSGLGGSKDLGADFLSGSLGGSLGGAIDDIFDSPALQHTGAEVVKNLYSGAAEGASTIANNLMKGSAADGDPFRDFTKGTETANVNSIVKAIRGRK